MTHPLAEPRIWDWALRMARTVSEMSKDPSTQVGAVIFDQHRRLVSAGYNGLPRGVEDSPRRLFDRETKLKMTIHAEKNAVNFATAPLHGSTLMCTHPCCTQCTAVLIQVGVKTVCWPKPDGLFAERWADDLRLSKEMFDEAGVTIDER